MNIYDVIHLLQKPENMDKVDTVLNNWAFNTSFVSPEVLAEIKKQLPAFHKMGEIKIYEYLKTTYNIKM
jgi:hypothetical protein